MAINVSNWSMKRTRGEWDSRLFSNWTYIFSHLEILNENFWEQWKTNSGLK